MTFKKETFHYSEHECTSYLVMMESLGIRKTGCVTVNKPVTILPVFLFNVKMLFGFYLTHITTAHSHSATSYYTFSFMSDRHVQSLVWGRGQLWPVLIIPVSNAVLYFHQKLAQFKSRIVYIAQKGRAAVG